MSGVCSGWSGLVWVGSGVMSAVAVLGLVDSRLKSG